MQKKATIGTFCVKKCEYSFDVEVNSQDGWIHITALPTEHMLPIARVELKIDRVRHDIGGALFPGGEV